LTFSELTDRPPGKLQRGETVICVYGTGDARRLDACLDALRSGTAPEHGVLIAGEQTRSAATGDLEAALRAAEPADAAVLAGDCVVPSGWLDGLRAAAEADPRIGIVSASEPQVAADDVAAEGAVDVSAPTPRCMFIRRAALELVGALDRSLPPAEALAELTDRCLAHGLRHVLATDVRVGGAPEAQEPQGEDAAPRSVTIDARCLGASLTGTAVATLDLIEGLACHTDLRLRTLVLDDLDSALQERLAGLGVELLAESAAETAPASDLVHRPYQVGAPRDLLLLSRLGRRRVITQLDTIAYRTAAYLDSDDAWREYRELTEVALASADEVVFLSPHAAADAELLDLVAAPRGTVIPLAVAHPGGPVPTGNDDVPLPERPYLLCLGTDFAHKNRRFALRLLEALLAGGEFEGRLVFAGPHVDTGSSAAEEAAYLAPRPRLAERILDLGPIGEVRKHRLLADAAAVVYPTTFEGFGLIPFEAAEFGVPALFAACTSLRDLFGEGLALLVPWDAEASARAAAPVLVPGPARDRQVDGVRAAAAGLTHEALARRHAELYDAVLATPRTPATHAGGRVAQLLAERGSLRDDVANYHRALSEIYQDPVSSGFVGPHAVVPDELQRAALALSMRPQLRDRAVALYRAAHALSRRFR
jgi:glycosyltransferase involved in cell wall biosynthesis